MGANVLLKLGGRIESLLAQTAGECADLQVALLMLPHEAGLVKTFPARETLEGFGLHVARHVTHQLVRLLEGSVAHLAHHLPVLVVREYLNQTCHIIPSVGKKLQTQMKLLRLKE